MTAFTSSALARYHDAGLVFGAHHGTGWISKAIRIQTRSRGESHISIVRNDGRLVESWQPKGMQDGRLLADLAERVDIYLLPCAPQHRDAAHRFLREAVVRGQGYDWIGVLRFVSRRLVPPAEERWFCSEVAHAASREAKRSLFARTEDWEVSPGLFVRSNLLHYVGTLNGEQGAGWHPVPDAEDPVPVAPLLDGEVD